MNLDLGDLFMFGRVAGFDLGTPLDTVIPTLQRQGNVREWKGFADTVLFKAGGLELHFFDDALYSVILIVADAHAEGDILVFGEKRVTPRTTLRGIVGLLEEHGIGWRADPAHCVGKQVELITQGSAGLQFTMAGRVLCLDRVRLSEDRRFEELAP
ncbi:MAG: hypothetical protein AAFU77_07970 [Myxococcota bacterium]